MWGRFDGGDPRRRLPRRRQPGPGAGHRGRRRGVRRAGARPRTHRLDDRRAAGGGPGLLERRRRQLGPAARGAVGAAAPRRSPRRRWSRPTRWSGGPPASDLNRALSGVRRDVHRGGRGLAGVRRGSRALPGAGPQLISRGWSFARFDGDELIFKAEVACATPYAAQIQGVYVPPDRRGQGIAAAGMAARGPDRPARDRARRCRSTSTTGTPPPVPSTRRSASARRPASRR